MIQHAVFLDRDGTIIEDIGYLSRVEDIRWIKGAKEAIRLLRQHGFRVVVVTNQSGAARGYFPISAIDKVHKRLNDDLLKYRPLTASGISDNSDSAAIDAFYYCPHHPAITGPCNCRKPLAGLIFKAAEELGLTLDSSSYMIGDNLRDIEAGINANISPYLVLTGKGKDFAPKVRIRSEFKGVRIAPTVLDAVKEIIGN